MRFGISFDDDGAKGPQTKGRIYLGEFSEQIIADLEFWSMRDYLDHWAATIARCQEHHPRIVFCSSRSRENWTLWVGRKIANGYRFFNVIALASEQGVRLTGDQIELDDSQDNNADDHRFSHWDVGLDCILASPNRSHRKW